jgi:putative membrane protein
MGAADVVPGVSGGTIAFIFGIYEELLDSIRSIDAQAIGLALRLRWRALLQRVAWPFLLALGSGILLAIFTLSRGLEWMFEHQPALLYGFFFGLVGASVITIRGRVKRWDPRALGAAAASALVAYWIVGLVPTRTPDSWWFYLLSGAIAICAMILPGISGSFILLLLGKYRDVLGAVNDLSSLVAGIGERGLGTTLGDPLFLRSFGILALVSIGALIGILGFARVVSWLFERYHDLTVAALIGLMVGSLRKVWPWKETLETMLDRHGVAVPLREANILPAAMTSETWAVIGLALLGFVLVFGIDWIASAADRRRDG